MKGLISEAKRKVPRTHSLIELLNVCSGIKPQLSEFETDCLKLDKYYIPTRYPDALPGSLPDGLPNKSDAEGALKILDKVNALVRK